MSQPPSSLVGSVVERSSNSKPPRPFVTNVASRGFPAVQHRSKSAFARARESRRRIGHGESAGQVPVVKRSGRIAFSIGQDVAEEEEEEKESLHASQSEASEAESSTSYLTSSSSRYSESDEWKSQMSTDNDRAIEAMTDEEIEQHKGEILQQFGPNVLDLFRRAKQAKGGLNQRELLHANNTESENPNSQNSVEASASNENNEQSKKRQREDEILQPTPSRSQLEHKLNSSPRGILVSNTPPISRSSTPGRALRKLRFADITPKDIHEFVSEPSSPRRPLGLLLPPPMESSDEDLPSIRYKKGGSEMDLVEDIRRSHFGTHHSPSSTDSISEPEEGTPEDIRRRFFPHLPPRDPSLEWIEGSDSSAASSDAGTEPRFDLTGAIIPISQRASIPTHLGLHHHGGPTSAAGYTLQDLLLLARSSVPSQRATILGVLSKIILRLSRSHPNLEELVDREEEIRKSILAAGLDAFSEKGSLGVQAIDLVGLCIAEWDYGVFDQLEGVELRPQKTAQCDHEDDEHSKADVSLSSEDLLSSIPLQLFLPQLTSHFSSRTLPEESLSQLLNTICRLAVHSTQIADAIIKTPDLIRTIIDTFLHTPIPPSSGQRFPNPRAIRLLRVLIMSNRENAVAVLQYVDTLLRFVTTAIPISNSPFPHPLGEALLIETLHLYTSLASYGLYTGVATTAADYFQRLSPYIFSDENTSTQLTSSWLRLLTVWMVCARDPHCTTPHHDLLWSQIVGWSWGEDLMTFRSSLLQKGRNSDLSGDIRSDFSVWASLWYALSAWLEGCRVNSVRAGKDERCALASALGEEYVDGGLELTIIRASIASLQSLTSKSIGSISGLRERVVDLKAISTFSHCLHAFSRLVISCVQGLSENDSTIGGGDWVKDLKTLFSPVAYDLALSNIWTGNLNLTNAYHNELEPRIRCFFMRPASAFMANCVMLSQAEGDWIPLAVATLERILPAEEETALNILEHVLKAIGNEDNSDEFASLMPFFKHMVRPSRDIYMAPCVATPLSVQKTTTLCLSANAISQTSKQAISGIPLKADWPIIALNHILRSGTSPVLSNPGTLPPSWNATETELTQASLKCAKLVQEKLVQSSISRLAMSCEKIAFTCMKVFMLEHDQPQNDSSEEVFRDPIVGQLMNDLLLPFTISKLSHSDPTLPSDSLEDAARDFLGSGTPFYQFFTDFVALYDAISFSHPTFARLLLMPTSMKYALDYRKHLWGDFAHVLRTVHTPIDALVVRDLKDYLWPFETDAEMIGWYLRALVKWTLEGAPRFIAIHHIACNIWPDLQDGPLREKRAKMLLLAVVNQAQMDVVKDVVRYTQTQDGETRLPPYCLDCNEDRKVTRLEYVAEWGGTQMMGRLEKIFGEKQ